MQTREIARPIRQDYYFWLCDLVNDSRNRESFLLMRTLHDKKFISMVQNDDNRAFEGINLRERFCEEFESNDDASLLEVMIGLALRCENIMADRRDSKELRHWFWILLSNCGLDRFTDEHFHDRFEGLTVHNIIDRIINRTYGRNGVGGLFPLKCSKKNQRKVELWYQMNDYLVENYFIDEE